MAFAFKYFLFLVVTAVISLSESSFGHALLVFPPPRNSSDGLKKPAPCGGVARTAQPLQLLEGTKLDLKWKETINHPGQFDFAVLTDGDSVRTVIGSYVKKAAENNNNLPHEYQLQVTLPAGIICDSCTLQMIQVMKENPDMPSYYYSCADIKIVRASDKEPPPPVPPAQPSPRPPTPSPQPPPDPNSSGVGAQGTSQSGMGSGSPKFASGCGTLRSIKMIDQPGGGLAFFLVWILPTALWGILRLKSMQNDTFRGQLSK